MTLKYVNALIDDSVWSALWLCVIVTFLLAFILHQRRVYSYWSRRQIPGPPALPVIGNNLLGAKQPLHLLDESMKDTYGRLVGFYNMSTPFLLVADVNLINEITVKKFPFFSDRRDHNEHNILRKFLSAMQGEQWKRVRSFISPAFSTGKIRSATSLMVKPVQLLCDEIKNKLSDEKCTEMELKKYLCALTLDITIRSAFGVELETKRDPLIMKHSLKVLNMSMYRIFLSNTLPQCVKRWMNFSVFPVDSISYMTNLAETMMLKRIKSPSKERASSDFVDVMINALNASSRGKEPLTMDEATSNCLLMLIAGFETTASLLTFTIFCLAHHQEQQDKLRDELKNNRVNLNDEACLDQSLSNLVYLDCVINETLRLYPPVTRLERIAREKVELSNGLILSPGTVVAFPIYALQRDKSYWTSPDSFKPDRFAPENKSSLIAHAFMPFGEGPRNCVGMRFALMEAKLTLAKLLLSFKFTPSPLCTWPLQFPNSTYLLSSDAIHVQVHSIT